MSIQDYKTSELENELARRKAYKLPPIENWWKVTTEGDEEGRTTKDLGSHFGRLPEIAMKLGSSGGYTLRFNLIPPPKELEIPIMFHTVNISIANYYVQTHMKELQDWVGPDYKIEKCGYYDSVTLKRI